MLSLGKPQFPEECPAPRFSTRLRARGKFLFDGDEKFYVDGEKFPSTFGTGSEDYVGYAWSAEAPFPMFESPFASQPHVPIDSNGHTSINRFHIADNVPFRKSFTAVIERFKTQVDECETDYVAYFYLRPDQEDPYGPLPADELELQEKPRR